MPHTNIWETNGLYRVFTGELPGEEILEANFELQSCPEFQFIQYIINDFSDVISHSVSPDHTEVYATTDEIFSNTKGRLKIALVVTKEELIALARHYKELMQGKLFECEIFQTVSEAREWVNLKSSDPA